MQVLLSFIKFSHDSELKGKGEAMCIKPVIIIRCLQNFIRYYNYTCKSNTHKCLSE